MVPLPKKLVMAFTWEESVGSSLLDIFLGKTYKIFDSLWLSPQGLLKHCCSMETADFISPFLLCAFDSVFLYLNMFYPIFSFLNNLISISILHLFSILPDFSLLFSLASNSLLIYSSIHFLFIFFYVMDPTSQYIPYFTPNNITYILLFFSSFLCLPATPWHWTLSRCFSSAFVIFLTSIFMKI